jgi:hypothetical protein
VTFALTASANGQRYSYNLLVPVASKHNVDSTSCVVRSSILALIEPRLSSCSLPTETRVRISSWQLQSPDFTHGNALRMPEHQRLACLQLYWPSQYQTSKDHLRSPPNCVLPIRTSTFVLLMVKRFHSRLGSCLRDRQPAQAEHVPLGPSTPFLINRRVSFLDFSSVYGKLYPVHCLWNTSIRYPKLSRS